jgi:hypothetical protein
MKERRSSKEQWPPRADGTIVKDKLAKLDYAGTVPGRPRPQITLRTFGRFDVFLDGKLVNFTSAKAKELLALCVDRNGGDVTMEEAIDKALVRTGPMTSAPKIFTARLLPT